MPTAQPDEMLGHALPVQPTTTRVFSTDDTLVTFAEIYNNEAATPHTVDITTTLRSADDGRFAFQFAEERSTDEIGDDRGGFGQRAVIPLADVASGPYVLTTEARSRLGGAATATRRLGLTVQ